ncbi:retrotransposon protein, putative, ty1-copia subclass [Tanacetum coccineum]
MLQELKSMFDMMLLLKLLVLMLGKEGKSVADYVLKMKGYMEQLERLGYMLPQDISVGLILNGLTKDFVGFVRNYNMHNMGKTIGEIPLHGLLERKGSKLALPVLQGFRIERKLKQGALYLYVGNGVRAQVEAIGSFDLVLPNDLVICLDKCHYAPTITRGVVSVSRLVDNGFIQCFTDYGISASKNGVLYFNAVSRNGLSGKMTKKPFPHSNERAKDLLGIIHTDVCGPLRHVSRQVFKNEVENQLGKTIKAIRSDRGGEYISQEFKDYLKANGIVQQLTPPYTPQHNGVSERRNRTLLDMVRSMMNLTTLPLSFWDYALESATRILNMVPTKKPDKLEQRSVKCIFIGYPKETMGYYFYFPPENKIVVARYAEFFEKRLISQEISGRAVDLEEIQEEEDTTPSKITSNIPQEF